MRWAGGDLLTQQTGMIIPVGNNPIKAAQIWIGTKLYDLIGSVTGGGSSSVSSSKMLGHKSVINLVTSAKNFTRGLLMYDGAHIDHRTVMHLLNSASQPSLMKDSIRSSMEFVPANIVNYCRATSLDI